MPKDKESKSSDFAEMVNDIISEIFAEKLEDKDGKKSKKNEELEVVLDSSVLSEVYESIEDYTEKTGKRFRMTRNQKDRDLTRDQAFEEFIQENKDV